MAKIYTEVDAGELGIKRMRFGYKTIKQLDQSKDKMKGMTEIELVEYMVFLALKEDDKELKIEQIEDIIDEVGIDETKRLLEETMNRDMPGFMNKVPQLGEQGPNE